MLADELTQDLRSDDPDRVASALWTLESALEKRHHYSLPMPHPRCLRAFGEVVPLEMVRRYIRLVTSYPGFYQEAGTMEVSQAIAEVVIRYGRGELSSDLALLLQADDDPNFAVSWAFRYLEQRGFHDELETLAARRLIDHLLDSETTRVAMVEVLRSWASVDLYSDLVQFAWPRLNDAEKAVLNEAREG